MHNLSTSAQNTLTTESLYHDSGRDHPQQLERAYTQHQFDLQLQKILKKEQKLKNNLAFWNGLADGRLESMAGIMNLFLLMLIESLGSKLYNGPDSNAPVVIGWISVAQVSFAYLLVVIVKFCYVPKLQAEVMQNKNEGFMVLSSIHKRKRQLADLKLQEIEVLLELFSQRPRQVKSLIPKNETESLINQLNQLLNSHSHQQYQYNIQISAVKEREKKAKYWQAFWQSFMLNKTYSVPGTMFLLFIIILASITKYSGQNIIAQGWIASGLWIGSIIVYIFIKQVLWNYLNQQVEKAKSEPFVNFNSVYYKFKELKSMNLKQLQELQEVLLKRLSEFQTCFPSVNTKETLQGVQNLIFQLLPQKRTQVQLQRIKQIKRKQSDLQTSYATWLNFFNTKTISTIINILKFLIVMALSFMKKYPQTSDDIRNAQITVGSLGIATLVFGQIFYWYLACFGLQRMDKQAKQASSRPFVTFSLVYLGNKQLKDLKIYQIQEISKAIQSRRHQFANCFPNANIQSLLTEIKQRLSQKVDSHYHSTHLSALLKKQLQAKQRLTFWAGYCDGPLMTSMYSIYVLLVLLIFTLIAGNSGAASALGWVGVAVIGSLILMVLFFKCYLLEYLAANLRALKVPGISEFHLAYTKVKELKNVEPHELQELIRIIKVNPDQFSRCFPTAHIQNTLHQIQQTLNAQPKPLQSQQFHYDIKIQLQMYKLELNRNKNLLAIWSSVIKERLYVILPILIVIYILWVQSIAPTLYGFTVCGFLTVGFVSVALFLILFFNLWYRQHLEAAIRKNESDIRLLESELHH